MGSTWVCVAWLEMGSDAALCSSALAGAMSMVSNDGSTGGSGGVQRNSSDRLEIWKLVGFGGVTCKRATCW